LALPAVAVTVLLCGLNDARVAVKTPAALVVPLRGRERIRRSRAREGEGAVRDHIAPPILEREGERGRRSAIGEQGLGLAVNVLVVLLGEPTKLTEVAAVAGPRGGRDRLDLCGRRL